jgi:hypothetical protein
MSGAEGLPRRRSESNDRLVRTSICSCFDEAQHERVCLTVTLLPFALSTPVLSAVEGSKGERHFCALLTAVTSWAIPPESLRFTIC